MSDFKYPPAKTIMLSQHLMQRGITDPRVLKAMSEVPREEFVPEHLREFAYQDNPLPIGFDQTISQPYLVALMAQLLVLTGREKVLDIGTGSGYQAAVISRLVKQVITIEKVPELAKQARDLYKNLKYGNITVVVGDGALGYSPQSPYDAIKSAAAAAVVSPFWKKQLKNNGRLVMPLDLPHGQDLIRITKKGGRYLQESWGEVAFVPLVS